MNQQNPPAPLTSELPDALIACLELETSEQTREARYSAEALRKLSEQAKRIESAREALVEWHNSLYTVGQGNPAKTMKTRIRIRRIINQLTGEKL